MRELISEPRDMTSDALWDEVAHCRQIRGKLNSAISREAVENRHNRCIIELIERREITEATPDGWVGGRHQRVIGQ